MDSASMSPQLGVGGTTPRPRNDMTASKAMAEGISSVVYTISGADRFGSTSTNMIRKFPAPPARAASVYSFSLMDMARPRTMRPTAAQENSAMTTMITSRLGPTTDTSAMAASRNGNDSTRSMSRDSTESTNPPRNPASRPMVVPMMTALTLEKMPTISEIRAPYMVRTNTSRPRSSVPNQ